MSNINITKSRDTSQVQIPAVPILLVIVVGGLCLIYPERIPELVEVLVGLVK